MTEYQKSAGEKEEELPEGGKVMSVFSHLDELRSRLIRSFLALFVVFCIALFFSTEIIEFLKRPLIATLANEANPLHFTGPLDVFMATIKVSVLSAIVFASPIWIYQFWRFVEPALYARERRYVLPFAVASIAMFFIGLSFCYFLILPLALEWLIGLGKEVSAPMITITDYLAMLGIMLFGFGFVFEAPLILVLCGTLDVVNAASLRKWRRHTVVLTLIIGAILTPPDPLSQIGMAVPLYIMYEMSIFVIAGIEKRRKKLGVTS